MASWIIKWTVKGSSTSRITVPRGDCGAAEAVVLCGSGSITCGVFEGKDLAEQKSKVLG